MVRAEQVEDYIIVGLDIARYSEKTIEEQREAQSDLDRMLHEAVKVCRKPNSGHVRWLDAGDGGYALLRWNERDVLDVVEQLYKRVDRANHRAKEDRQLSVRTAIHLGQLICWDGSFGPKYAGDAINSCARLLAGMNREHDGQVVCSGEFYKKISTFQPTANTLRLKDVKDKHGRIHEIYNLTRDPGFGVHPSPRERHPDFTRR